jgi:hypothetical protein
MPMSVYTHWLPIAVGLFLRAASIAVGFNAGRRCAAIRNSRSWPAVKAEVTYTDIDSDYNPNMEETVYSPKVWYRYQVDMKTHEGQFELPTSINPDIAEKTRAPYRKGRSLVVRYDPRDPQRAVIEGQSVRLRDIGLVATATIAGAIGLVLIASSLFDR